MQPVANSDSQATLDEIASINTSKGDSALIEKEPLLEKEKPENEVKQVSLRTRISEAVFRGLIPVGLVGSSVVLGLQLAENRDLSTMTYAVTAMGATLAVDYHVEVPMKYRERVFSFLQGLYLEAKYPVYFIVTQVWLNVRDNLSPATRKVLSLGWPFAFGGIQALELIPFAGIRLKDLRISSGPLKQGVEPLSMWGFSADLFPRQATLIAGIPLPFAIAGTTLHFIYRDTLFWREGVLEACFGFLTGSAVAGLLETELEILRFAIERKIKQVKKERSEDAQFTKKRCSRLCCLRVSKKALRVQRTVLFILGSTIASYLLPDANETQTVSKYLKLCAVGGLIGAEFVVAGEEFRNPRSLVHEQIRQAKLLFASDEDQTILQKVQRVVRYTLSPVVVLGMMIFMLTAGLTEENPLARVGVVPFVTALPLAFSLTAMLLKRFDAGKNGCFVNTLTFLLGVNGGAWLPLFYWWFTTNFPFDDEALRNGSGINFVGSAFWGIAVGQNQAMGAQWGTPHLISTELTRTFATMTSSSESPSNSTMLT